MYVLAMLLRNIAMISLVSTHWTGSNYDTLTQTCFHEKNVINYIYIYIFVPYVYYT